MHVFVVCSLYIDIVQRSPESWSEARTLGDDRFDVRVPLVGQQVLLHLSMLPTCSPETARHRQNSLQIKHSGDVNML